MQLGARNAAAALAGRLSDLYELDPLRLTWTRLNGSGPGPTARDEHGLAGVGDELYVMGGRGSDGSPAPLSARTRDLFPASSAFNPPRLSDCHLHPS